MPVTLQNLTLNAEQELKQSIFCVQYPFPIEAKVFASIPMLHDFKLERVMAAVVNPSTTKTTFSVVTPTITITVDILAGETISTVWIGEEVISAGGKLTFKINSHGTGSFLTMIVEGKYI